MEIRPVQPDDQAALIAFFHRMPEADRTFFKEDVDDPDVVTSWARPGGARVIAVEGGEVLGSVAVVPLHGWSSHVGEVRLVVDPERRGRGIGPCSRRWRCRWRSSWSTSSPSWSR